MIGTSIEHYQIIERLGQGGMGAVYRATDTLLEREVALKLLRPEYASDPAFAERFRAEAVTLAKLSHPNIATLFGFVKDSSQLCMVMELATGETLTNVLKRTGAMSWERSILLVGQMLDALQYAHERGVVHRDIKPSNLMVGQDDHLKLMDFGIARLMGTTRVTQMGFTVGTLEYMAPEQIRGEDVDGRADIYATGVVLYEMVTGQLPFGSSREQALMFAHLQQEVVPPRTYRPNLPWHLSDVIVRSLAKAPGDRFSSAREFSDALGASIGSSTATVRVPIGGHTVTGSSASPRRRTSASQRITAAAGSDYVVDDSPTREGVPAGQGGWLGKWWPTVRVSSNKFGGAKEPGVMYQAEVGAGGFGGAIRIVAVRMTSAGRRAVGRATQVMRGATGQLVRHPAFLVILLLLAGIGGGWYWKQRQAKADDTGLSAASLGATGNASIPSAPAGPPPTSPAPTPTPAPAASPAPAPLEPVVPAASGDSGASAPAAVTPAATSISARVPASNAKVPAASTTTTTAASSRSPAPAAPTPVVHEATASTSAPVVPERPAAPVLPDVKLENTITLLTPKDDDVEETEGTLTLHGNEIVIIDEDDKVVRTVRLRADGPGKGPAASGPAQIYTHRRDRWLVLPVAGDRLVVQIDRDDIPKLIAALETRLGRPVTTVDGEPKFPKH